VVERKRTRRIGTSDVNVVWFGNGHSLQHLLFVEGAGNGSLRLTFIGLPDLTYRVQWTQDLANSNWQDLGSWTADTYGSFELIDTPPANSPARYYRTVWP